MRQPQTLPLLEPGPERAPRASSIVDNREGDTLLLALEEVLPSGAKLGVATAFFSLDALLSLAEALTGCDGVRILFGSDAAATGRNRLVAALRLRSDNDLLAQREQSPSLERLRPLLRMIENGRLEARCYTRAKFHAKAYLVHRTGHPPLAGILGRGHFTFAYRSRSHIGRGLCWAT